MDHPPRGDSLEDGLSSPELGPFCPPLNLLLLMSQMGHSRPNWVVRDTSGSCPIAKKRTSGVGLTSVGPP